MKQCRNYIVRACLTNAMHNARTPLGHNLAFFRNKYGIDIMCDDYNNCMRSIRNPNLRTVHPNNIEHLNTLVLLGFKGLILIILLPPHNCYTFVFCAYCVLFFTYIFR